MLEFEVKSDITENLSGWIWLDLNNSWRIPIRMQIILGMMTWTIRHARMEMSMWKSQTFYSTYSIIIF